ncbi:MAG: hypothetical protein WAT79_06315 [Saprospiraceae bacterium]
MRLFIHISILCLISIPLMSQNLTDIVRWSTFQPSGTAAALGVNNSLGAIGGDIMSAHINPAGIGEFKQSTFTFTGGFDIRENSAWLTADANSKNTLRSGKFGVHNLGLVFGNYRPNKNFTSSNFAIGFTRQTNFKNKVLYSGKTIGTITEHFAERANGLTPDQLDDFDAYPAYFTGAIFDFDGDKNYETDFAQNDLLVNKQQNINSSGYVNELSFTWAGEYKNKVNIGVGIGIPFAQYSEQKVYEERDNESEIATFNYLQYIQDLDITGVGFNAKLGVIFKPASWLRIGGAFHSPTWFTFEDTYSTSMEYSYDDETNIYPGSNDVKPELQFKYNISNPYKAIGSLGSVFQLGDIHGFVNVDLEYVDYLSAEYDGTAHSDDPSEINYTNKVNSDIINSFQSAVNFRLGGELAYDIFRVRGGFYQFKSPFANEKESYQNYTFGAGFRGDKFYLDFALQFSNALTGYNAYTVTNKSRDPLVNVDSKQTLALLTLGFKI